MPWLIGGAADLAPSTKTNLTSRAPAPSRRTATAAATCISASASTPWARSPTAWRCRDLRAYGSSFLIFTDYMQPPIRLAAIMELPTIFVFTHDSIGVGEDGPTHQPIEQLLVAARHPRPDHDPARRRQRGRRGLARGRCSSSAPAGLPGPLPPGAADARPQQICAGRRASLKGAYVLAEPPDGEPEVILIGTGSEVQLCVGAYEKLTAEGIKRARRLACRAGSCSSSRTRPIATACCRPTVTARVAVEQARDASAGTAMSAPAAPRSPCIPSAPRAPLAELQEKFGFTPTAVAQGRARRSPMEK